MWQMSSIIFDYTLSYRPKYISNPILAIWSAVRPLLQGKAKKKAAKSLQCQTDNQYPSSFWLQWRWLLRHMDKSPLGRWPMVSWSRITVSISWYANGPASAPSENKTHPPTNWRNSYHYATRRNIGQFYFDGSQQYAYFSAGIYDFYFMVEGRSHSLLQQMCICTYLSSYIHNTCLKRDCQAALN